MEIVEAASSPKSGHHHSHHKNCNRLQSTGPHSHHKNGNHLLILEGGKFSYVSLPSLPAPETEQPKLCFTDHSNSKWDPRAEQCCSREGGHVHAHVHVGETTEDVLLEECMDEAGCALPTLWDLPGSCLRDLSDDNDHVHREGCGHNQIAHGDHMDWLVPMSDGSFLLSHAHITDDGASQFIEHGRLVKVGESQGTLRKRPRQLFDLFGYEGPKDECCNDWSPALSVSKGTAVKSPQLPINSSCTLMREPSDDEKVPLQEGTIKLQIDSEVGPCEIRKTTIDVLGLCCPAEVSLVKKILETSTGVEEISVNVAAKTVTVWHDPVLTPPVRLVKLLNDARLEASIHHAGQWKSAHMWPSPYTIASGFLVALTFFHYLYSPLQWVGLGAVAVGIPPIIFRSWISLRHCILDINVLMLIAVAGSIGLKDYLEAGSIVFLFTLADWLESCSSDKARLAISAVASLAPQSAVLADNGLKVPVAEVEVGTNVSVKAGELIPIDGIVVSGKCAVDESSLTGESCPVEKVVGGSVWAGTMNMTGFIRVQTTALAEDSAVSRMVRLVMEAQTQRSHVEQFVERVAKFYTPAVVIIAIAIATLPLSMHANNVRHWLYLALVLLVVACPCALVISTPVATTCAIARSAQMGLIVKGGRSLEALGKLKVLAMDKTGTLTEGHFEVAEVQLLNSQADLQNLFYWVSSIESKSSHPMASALIAHAKLHGIVPCDDVKDFTILAGEGVSGIVDGRQIHIGNDRLANRLHWKEAKLAVSSMVETWNSRGWTICWVAVDENPKAIMCVGDQVRSEASSAVSDMRDLGLQVAMLTGDSWAAANAAHEQLGEIDIYAQLLPEDKVEVLKQLRKMGLTGMVGDGINDAPALAAADVGIAMGVAGTAVAMETADIALMTNDLRRLATAVKLGRKARRKIQQNIFLSIATKLLVVVLAATGHASLWGAVLADAGTCLVVIFNSMFLLGRGRRHDRCNSGACHSKPQLPKSSGCCKTRKCGRLSRSQDCSSCTSHQGHPDHLQDCSVEKSCCELSVQSSSSGMRRRLEHKDSCGKNCQGIDCSSTLIIRAEGLGTGKGRSEFGDCCGSVADFHEMSCKEDHNHVHQDATPCATHGVSEPRNVCHTDHNLSTLQASSDNRKHLEHDISLCVSSHQYAGHVEQNPNNSARSDGQNEPCASDCKAVEYVESCSAMLCTSEDEGHCHKQSSCCDRL